MDARLHPAKYADLAEGDAHVIRNAGGRASTEYFKLKIRQTSVPDDKSMFYFGQ